MGTHFSFIFRAYDSYILGLKTFICLWFWGPKGWNYWWNKSLKQGGLFGRTCLNQRPTKGLRRKKRHSFSPKTFTCKTNPPSNASICHHGTQAGNFCATTRANLNLCPASQGSTIKKGVRNSWWSRSLLKQGNLFGVRSLNDHGLERPQAGPQKPSYKSIGAKVNLFRAEKKKTSENPCNFWPFISPYAPWDFSIFTYISP